MMCQGVNDAALGWGYRCWEDQSLAASVISEEQELGIESKGRWVVEIYLFTTTG